MEKSKEKIAEFVGGFGDLLSDEQKNLLFEYIGLWEKGKEQEWVSVEERYPDEEGEYLCCDQFHYCPGKEKANIYRVLDFKFSVMRTTGERVIDEDGITGGFQDKNAYGQRVTHWQPLPAKPKTL